MTTSSSPRPRRRPLPVGLLGAVAFASAVAVYWDPDALRGDFVYDDVASVLNNGVVTGSYPAFPDVLLRDFWGNPMSEPRSHKSYRPLTTLTLRWNWSLADHLGDPDRTYYFHVFNVLLHGVNAGLVTEIASRYVFADGGTGGTVLAPLAAGLIFGIHPVHAEAVSNVTSRGELLMTTFFCLAFLSYASRMSSSPPTPTPTSTSTSASAASTPPGSGEGATTEKSAGASTSKTSKPFSPPAASSSSSSLAASAASGSAASPKEDAWSTASTEPTSNATTSPERRGAAGAGKSNSSNRKKTRSTKEAAASSGADGGSPEGRVGKGKDPTTAGTASADVDKTRQQQQQPSTQPSRSSSTGSFSHFACVYVLPCLFMALSLFSKEQGATTLCSLVAYDFVRRFSSARVFLRDLRMAPEGCRRRQRRQAARDFLKRTSVLAAQTVLVVGVRYWLNGESSPDFVYEQNPAGFQERRFRRVFTVNWIYCLYLRDMLLPVYLAPDWSGDGIPIVESFFGDRRAWCVVALWCFFAGCVYSLLFGGGGEDDGGSPAAPSTSTSTPPAKETATTSDVKTTRTATANSNRQIFLMSFFAFMFLPFLLSSNLLVTTGLAKADRVIYLPLLGFCLMEALVLKMLVAPSSGGEATSGGSGSGKFNPRNAFLAHLVLGLQLSLFVAKTQERNLAWSSELALWTKAFDVNPRSLHTRSNAGRVLAKSNQWEKAEKVLRPIKDARKTGYPSDTFLYTVSLSKFNRCKESFKLIDDAIKYIHEQRQKGGIRYNERMSLHEESSLMISRAFCTDNIMEKGRIMHEAVTLDPQNTFAASQFQNYLETLEKMRQQQQLMQQQQQQQQRQQRQ